MQRLKIAILSPIHWRTPPRKQGAWELVASNVTEELVKRGHDVTLFATADSITKAKLVSVAPRPLLEVEGKDLESKLYGYMHTALPFEMADQFDVIHNHYDGYPLVFSKLVNTPVVTTVHGFSSPQVKELYRRYNNTQYVSISMSDRRNCPDMNWVANIYHGIDMNELPFGGKPQDYYAYLARVHPTKGTHIAIKAALKAGVKLRIAAHIDENDNVVKKYWKEQCLPFIDGKQIVFTGEADARAKSELLRGAIALLCPIQWEEPFGLVFVESMASGTPVIAYGRGSAPEVINHNTGGFVVEPDNLDAFIDAMRKAPEINRKAIRSYAESMFTIQHMVDQYEKVYLRAIASAK